MYTLVWEVQFKNIAIYNNYKLDDSFGNKKYAIIFIMAKVEKKSSATILYNCPFLLVSWCQKLYKSI